MHNRQPIQLPSDSFIVAAKSRPVTSQAHGVTWLDRFLWVKRRATYQRGWHQRGWHQRGWHQRGWRQRACLWLSLLMLGSGSLTAWAGEQWQMVGLQIEVQPAIVTAVRGVPFRVGYDLAPAVDGPQRPTIPADWTLAVDFNPPDGSAAQRYEAPLDWSGTLTVQPGQIEGAGTLTGWRIENAAGETVRLFDKIVHVTVLGDILVPQVEIKRLSYEEMRELGIIIGEDSYVAIQVSMELEIQESGEFLDASITLIKDENTGRYTPVKTGGERLAFAPVSFGFTGSGGPTTGVLSTNEMGPAPKEAGRPRRTPPKIDAALIWPANIGFLNSFFKPTLIVLNVAPEESGYTIENLRANMDFPAGSLVLADLESGPQKPDSYIQGVGADGVFGTNDDTNAVPPQTKGQATWVLEGKKPGEHRLDFDIQGTIIGEDGLSYPIRGEAHGFIYVRAPRMNLHFEAPSTVREFDQFTVEAIFTNISDVPVNDLRFEFDEGAVSGATVDGITPYVNGSPVSGPVILENKGDVANFNIHMTSLSTGRVIIHNVSGGEELGGSITYSVKVAVGEHGLPVSAVALMMPKALKDGLLQVGYDIELYKLIKVVAGRALSLTHIPIGQRDNGFGHVDDTAIRDWIQDITYSVMKPRSGSLAEQRRNMAREVYFLSLAQPRNLVEFFGQDSKFQAMMDMLHGDGGDLSDLFSEDALVSRGALLLENATWDTRSPSLIYGDSEAGPYWQGFQMDRDFDIVEAQIEAGSLRGFFFNGYRWERWELIDLVAGSLQLIWDGERFEIVNDGARVRPTWTYGPDRPPALVAARQMGYETVAKKQIDLYGRQVLLYFSEPVDIDENFVQNFSIANNYVTHAERVRDQIVQVWVRNPIGLVERDIAALPGINTERGVPVEPIAVPIRMSDLWDAVTVEGKVFGPNGHALPGVEVGLLYATRRHNNQRQFNFTGEDDLASLGHGEFAQEVARIIEKYAYDFQREEEDTITYPFEFQTITREDGSYLMEMWPLYRAHSRNELDLCPDGSQGGPWCVDFRPDTKWTVAWGDRRTDRYIYGHYAGQRIIRDFIFPPQGKFYVHVPPLPDGQKPGPLDVVQIQGVDQDEFHFERVILPGETVEIEGFRYGPVSFLAKAIGGFDAKSVNLNIDTDGDTIILNPATRPAVVTGAVVERDRAGNEQPATTGFVVAYHYGAEFGGSTNKPAVLAVANLAEVDNGEFRLELPEGNADIVYARARDAFLPWTNVTLTAGESQDIGTFLYQDRDRGAVTVTVLDTDGTPKVDYPVGLQDSLGYYVQRTNENGQTQFREVAVGKGRVTIPIAAGEFETQEFTLSFPNQLSTTVDFRLEPPYQLNVEVLDADGAPVDRAWVKVVPMDLYPDGDQSALTDPNGLVRFSWGRPPPRMETLFNLEVQHPTNYRILKRNFTRGLDKFVETVTLQYLPTGVLDLTVVGVETLEKLANVWVEVTDASGNTYANVTDDTGFVRFEGLSPGNADVTLIPAIEHNDIYLETEHGIEIAATTDPQQRTLWLDVHEPEIPPRTVNIVGTVFDAYQNPMVDDPVKFRLYLRYKLPGEEIPVVVQIGDDHFSNGNGGIELVDVDLPGFLDAYTFLWEAYHLDTGNFSTGSVGWDRRTPEPYIPIQMNTTVTTKVRVWDEFGNRMRVGSIKVTQDRITSEDFDRDRNGTVFTLSDDDFTPEFQVKSGSLVAFKYQSPSHPDGISESTVIYPYEDGIPIDIVVQPLGSLLVNVNGPDGAALDGGVFLQIFKSGRLWGERVLDVDVGQSYMTLDELPYGNYSILAYQIATGYTDVWQGTVYDVGETATLNLLTGKPLHGRVLNTDNTPVGKAHLILTRGIGTLAFSNTDISGVSDQKLLGTTDENGYFSFPPLNRGSYNLRIFDPFTNRSKRISFSVPETLGTEIVTNVDGQAEEVHWLETKLRPVGKVALQAKLEDGSLAAGATVTVFRNGSVKAKGRIDALTGLWTTPWLEPGPVTFMVDSLDSTQKVLVNAEILNNQITQEVAHLSVIPYNPAVGFQWRDNGEFIGERITVSWRWTAPGGVAFLEGRRVYPAGDPIRFTLMEGELQLVARFPETQDHRSFSEVYTVNVDHSDDIIFQVERPRILVVKTVDTFGQPLPGVKISGSGAGIYTGSDATARIKSVTIGGRYSFLATSQDGLLRGSGSVIITDQLTTDLVIALHDQHGDLQFEVTQLGETYSKGLVTVSGNGVAYSQVLDGSNVLNFRFLAEGDYRWTYDDPVRGIRRSGWVFVDAGKQAYQLIEVPGGGPLEFRGEYAGGIPLEVGMVFYLHTQLKTFSTEIIDGGGGDLLARFDALPEGDWRLSTPTIPRSRWNPRIHIDHGVVNTYDAFGSLALPFWVRAVVTFLDKEGFTVGDFKLERIRVSDGRVVERRNYSNGLAVVSMPFGDWTFRAQPGNSPLSVTSDLITVDELGANHDILLQLQEDTSIYRFPLQDPDIGFISARVQGYFDDSGQHIGSEYANPFMTWDYLPAGVPLRFRIRKNSATLEFTKTLVPGFQEEDEPVQIYTVPPQSSLDVVWRDEGLPTLVVTTDKETLRVTMNGKEMVHDADTDTWRYDITAFSSPWRFGTNTVNIRPYGVHGANNRQQRDFQWPSAAPVTLTTTQSITELPVAVHVRVDDPAFEIDQDRLDHRVNNPPPTAIKVNGHRVPIDMLPAGENGIGYDAPILVWPWRQGDNSVEVVIYDINGVAAGMNTTVTVDLPALAAVRFTGLEYQGNSLVEIEGHGPNGEVITWTSEDSNFYDISDLPFGNWQFQLYNPNNGNARVYGVTTDLQSVVAPAIRTSWRNSRDLSVRVESEMGEPMADVPVHVTQETFTHGNWQDRIWDFGTLPTDSAGIRQVERLQDRNTWVTADFGDYQIRRSLGRNPPSELTIVDTGAGDVLVTVVNITDGGVPIVGLDVFLDGQHVGVTDAAGEFRSDITNAGRVLDLIVEGSTPDNGRVFETQTITTVRGTLPVEFNVEPFFEGSLNVTLDQSFEGLEGTIEIDGQRFVYPLTQPIVMTLREGDHPIRVLSRLGSEWFVETAVVVRNETTTKVLNAPTDNQIARALISVTDRDGRGLHDAVVAAAGVTLGRTDTEGFLEVPLFPDTYRFIASHEAGVGAIDMTFTAGEAELVLIATSGFSPRRLDGNVLWLHDDTAAKRAESDGSLSTWVDLSGADHHAAQAVANARPLAWEGPAGREAVRFDGVDDFLNLADGFTDFPLGFTAYMVVLPQSNTWRGGLLDLGNGRRNDNLYLERDDRSDRLVFGVRNGYRDSQTTGRHALRPYEYGVISAYQVSNDGTVYRDGLVTGTGGLRIATTVERTQNLLGKTHERNVSSFHGKMVEVLLFNRALSPSEQDEVGMYLADKYGLYHPEALWIDNYAATVQAEIHASGLTRELADQYAAFLAQAPPVPEAGLTLWLKPDAGVVETDGVVSTWQDQSPHGNHAAAVQNAEGLPQGPVVADNVLDGQAVMRFTTDATLQLNALAPDFNESTTTFVLFKPQESARTLFSTANTVRGTLSNYITANTLRMRETIAATDVSDQEVWRTWALMTLGNENNRRFQTRMHGRPAIDRAISLNDGDHARFELGRRWDGGSGLSHYRGDLAEVLVYNRKLSALETQQVENYLADKYALLMDTPAPLLQPAGGVYSQAVDVTLTTGVAGGTIHVTTDGSEPTQTSATVANGGQLRITADTVLRARVYPPAGAASPVQSAEYVINPEPATVIIDRTKTIWTVGTTEQDYEGKNLIITGADVTLVGAHTFNSLRLINGAVLKHRAAEMPAVDLTIVEDLYIDENSRIDVTGKGFAQESGPGAGTSGYYQGAGAGHGDRGGKGQTYRSVETSGGFAYGDDPTQPNQFGSGGGRQWRYNLNGGRGGGLVKLNIGGNLYLDGLILADGTTGGSSGSSRAGGGSGGSIQITTTQAHGTGRMHADGASGYRSPIQLTDRGFAGAAGGRIAVNFDALNSTFPVTHLHSRNGLGGGAISGTVYVNGAPIVQSAQLLVRAMDLNNVPMAGLEIRLSHDDGREILATTNQFGYVDLDQLTIGETWTVHTRVAGAAWRQNTPIYLADALHFHVMRVFDTAVALASFTDPFFADKRLDWRINGEVSALDTEPSFNGTTYTYQFPVRANENNRIVARLSGFQGGALVDETMFLDATINGELFEIQPNFLWQAVQPSPRAADSGPLSDQVALGAAYAYVDSATGLSFPLWEGTRVHNGTWSPENVYLPNNTSVALSYQFEQDGALVDTGALQNVVGETAIPLPYAVVAGTVRFHNGNPASADTGALVLSDVAQVTGPAAGSGAYRLVHHQPQNLAFDLRLGMTHGFLREQETGYVAETLDTQYDPVFEPHGQLFLPQVDGGQNLSVYVHHTANMGNYVVPFASGYSVGNWPSDSGLHQQLTDLSVDRTFYMPLGYWSVGGPEVASRFGQFQRFGEASDVQWTADQAPLATQDFVVRASTPTSQALLGTDAYRLFAISQHNPTYFQVITDPVTGGAMHLPNHGDVWFVLTYDQAASLPQKTVDGTIATSWLVRHTLSENERLDGTIQLDFSGEAIMPLDFDADHRLDFLPGLVRAGHGSDSARDMANVMAWSSRYDVPGNFLFSPMGWFSQVDVHLGPQAGEVVWRHKFQDFSRQLPGARIAVPLTYWPGDGASSGSVPAKAVENLGMEGIDTAAGFMFGMLTGHNRAWVQPEIAGPADQVDPSSGDVTRQLSVTMQLPKLFAQEWSLAFPMLIAPYSDGDDTAGFAQAYADWKTAFNTNDHALWTSMPLVWRADAVNWNALPNGITGSEDLPGVAMDLDALNDRLAVAHGVGGVTIFDVSTRGEPAALVNVDTLGDARAVAVSNRNYVVVADGPSGAVILDLRDPQTTSILAELTLAGYSQAVAAEGDYGVVGSRQGRLSLMNLAAGVVLNQTDLDSAIQDVVMRNGLVYVLSDDALHVFARNAAFSLLAELPHGAAPVEGVRGRLFLMQDLALASVGAGYRVFDIAQSDAPQLMLDGTRAGEVWRRLVRDENGFALAIRAVDGSDQPTIYDMDDPLQVPSQVEVYETPGLAHSLTLYNGLAYIADGEAGLQILNYADADLGSTPPMIDLFSEPAHSADAVTAVEGREFFVHAQAVDDVQIAAVEFYVDDVLVAVDGNYPFEYFTTMPAFAETPAFTLTARAIDTGGNATWSDAMTVTVAEAALQIIGVTPPDGSVFLQADEVGVFFNKPVDISTVGAASFSLVEAGVDGAFGTADDVTYSGITAVDKPDLAALVFQLDSSLPGGDYLAELAGTVADLDGNALGATYIWSFTIEGMLGHYTFDAHILDSSGNGHHADWPGGEPGPDRNGQPNQAYRFSDPGDQVFTRYASNQRSSGRGVTFSAWVYPTQIGDWRYVIYADSGGWDWSLLQMEGKWSVFYGSNWRKSAHDVELNVWQHLSAVFDPVTATATIYKNGVPSVINAPITYDSHSRNIEIGRNFIGRLDEVRIFNQALTADQAQTLYTMADGDVDATVEFDDHLLGYYPFRDGKPFDWTDGPLWDHGARELDGYFVRPDFTTDMHGTPRAALYFKGNNQLTLPFHIDQTAASKGFTASLWVRPEETGSQRDYLINTNNGGTDWALIIEDNSFTVLNGSSVIQTNLPVDYHQWQHVVAVFDPAFGVRVYKNLQRDDVAGIDFDSNTGPVWIGSRNDGNEAFTGKIDDVRLYDRMLDQAEIQRLYRDMNPVEDDGLVGHYTFDGHLDDSGPGQHDLHTHLPLLTEDRGGNPESAFYFAEGGDVIHSRLWINQRSDGPGVTFSAWIKPSDMSRVGYLYTDNGGWDWSLFTKDDRWSFFYGSSEVKSKHTIRPNVWQHMVVVVEPNVGFTLYKDGVPHFFPDLSYDSHSNYFSVRANDGVVDDVRVYRKPLSEEEVLALYHTPVGEEPALAALNEDFYLHWPLDASQPPTDDVVDASGNRYHGYFWSPVLGPDPDGNPNQAVVFEDSSDRLIGRYRINQGPTSNGLAFMGWVYPTQDNSTRRYIFSTDNGGYDWSMTHRSGAWHVFTGSSEQSTNIAVDYNRWQHVAGIWEPGVGVHFYKNGTEYTLIPEISTDVNHRDLFIGGYYNGADAFVGSMDHLYVYDRVVSQAEVQAAMGDFQPPSGDLIVHYDLNDVTPKLTDLSPFANPGNIALAEPAANRFGEPGMAYRFDGGDVFDTQFRVNQRSDGPGATYSVWVYPTSIAGGRQYPIYTDNGGWDWTLFREDERWGVFYGSSTWHSGHRVSKNEWQHLVVVFEPGVGITFYKNGVPRFTTNLSFDSYAERTRFGGLDGVMDDFRVYHRALSSAEVQALFTHDERDPASAPALYEDMYGYYPLDGDIRDYSGSDYHGTWRGPRTTQDPNGQPDRAFDFDGVDDYINITRKVNQTALSRGLSFAAWVYPRDMDSAEYVFTTDNGGRDWSLLQNNDQWSVFTGESHRNVGVGVDLNMWQHVAAVWDPDLAAVRFYKNGVEYRLDYLGYDTVTDILRVGRRSNGQYFNGRMDDVYIFEANLSAADIRAIYEASTPPDPEGLYAYYPLDGDLEDHSVNANSLNNGLPTPTTNRHGESGKALYFDGRDDWVDLPYQIDNSSSSSGATFAMWVKPDSYRSGTHYLVSGDNGGWDWSFTRNGERWAAFYGSSQNNSGWDVKPDIWVHLAVTFDPVTKKTTIYRDGLASVAAELSFDNYSQQLRIGAYRNGSGNFDGVIDEVFIYHRVLSQAEITALMQREDSAALTTGQQEQLLGYYPFDGDYLDAGPAGNHGTINTTVPVFEQDPSFPNNRYLRFDGIDDRILSDAYFNQRATTEGFTFIGWIYPEDPVPLQAIFSTDNGGFDWSLRFSGGEYKVFTGESEQITDGTFLRANEWQLVAAVWDPVAAETRVYANGEMVRFPLLAYDSGRWPVVLGYDKHGSYYQGLIDEVLLFHRPLTQTEIEAIFAKE